MFVVFGEGEGEGARLGVLVRGWAFVGMVRGRTMEEIDGENWDDWVSKCHVRYSS